MQVVFKVCKLLILLACSVMGDLCIDSIGMRQEFNQLVCYLIKWMNEGWFSCTQTQ